MKVGVGRPLAEGLVRLISIGVKRAQPHAPGKGAPPPPPLQDKVESIRQLRAIALPRQDRPETQAKEAARV